MRPLRSLVSAALLSLLPLTAGCFTFNDAVVGESARGEPSSGSPEDQEASESNLEEAPAAETPPTPAPPGATRARFAGTPVPEGCIADVTAGDRVYTCEGLSVDATIPRLNEACPAEGCGIIVELHGDNGTGPLLDAHLRLRSRAAPRGYIVLAPTSGVLTRPGRPPISVRTWQPADDAKIVAITRLFAKVFKANPKRIHVTGFNRGGFMTWRLGCDQPTLFASAAPAGAGNGTTLFLAPSAIEPTCFGGGRAPTRPLPILELIGRNDAAVAPVTMFSIKDAALASYGIRADEAVAVKTDATFTHFRATRAGASVVEWFDHAYETSPTGPTAGVRGHCLPGSPVDPNAGAYAFSCNPTPVNGFDWGAEVLAFFEKNPMP